MVILKKIQAATLVEVLTASVLIIIVFMVASLSFNNVFANQIKRDHTAIENRVKALGYFSIHGTMKLPYAEDFEGWEIMITSESGKTVLVYSKEGVEHEKVFAR
ncbi:hypothetical protein [Aquimarina mytili]|uniref:Uncharacterized protein n=1 Tax=Aquimarina mytili TaxID=874423 RepID=A0A936ZT55_9FLAO|nr:hypothetical protein [Aquimarina mytili]MBL0684198.1 hypothetical protein [Aquimarina mytili]